MNTANYGVQKDEKSRGIPSRWRAILVALLAVLQLRLLSAQELFCRENLDVHGSTFESVREMSIWLEENGEM